MFYLQKWFKKGIVLVYDVFDNQGILKKFNYIQNIGQNKFREIQGLLKLVRIIKQIKIT